MTKKRTEDVVILSVQQLQIVAIKNSKVIPLVHNLSFDLKLGEILGIVGESGSGKSITNLSLLGLLSPGLRVESGSAIFEDRDLFQLNEESLRKIRGKEIALIFQEPMSSMNPSLKCGEQVDEMILNHEDVSKSEARKRTIALFSKTLLPDPERAYNSYPHQLSGGQIQRVMISMAMACNPKILIADECTTALDVTVQQDIIDLLKSINKSLGISIIFISHDLGVISDIADRVMVMDKGSIVELETVKNIFLQPKESYTKQLIASRPPLKEQIVRLPEPSYFDNPQATREAYLSKYERSDHSIESDLAEISNAEILFEVKDLSKMYTTSRNFFGKPTAFVRAVDQVSLSIRKGETVGLVGESGCGKSTLAKSMLRLIEADRGDVLFEGQSLYALSDKELRLMRKNVQYIFQDPYSSLNPRLPIGYAIEEPMVVHNIRNTKKERKERVIDLLEKVGLEADHYKRYPHEFSGGQRQRICIARALGLNPKFIVCDEIVSALDVSVQAQVLNLLKDLKSEFGLSLLFVSHDLSVVKFISDRILVMKAGRIVEEGFAHKIYENAKHPYTKALIDAIPGKSLTVS